MFDIILNYIIIFIPIAIFITRAIISARNKHKKPIPKKQDPIHFEDKNLVEKASARKPAVVDPIRKAVLKNWNKGKSFLDKPQSAAAKQPASAKQPVTGLPRVSLFSRTAMTATQPAAPQRTFEKASAKAETPIVSPVKKVVSVLHEKPKDAPVAKHNAPNDFLARLKHLSPLKQAVVMTGILGPPKGLT